MIAVTGNLHARNLDCEGDQWVGGNAYVDETAFGFYEAGSTVIAGELHAALFLAGNHDFNIGADCSTTHLAFDNFDDLSIGTKKEARAVLSDAALTELGALLGIGDEGSADDYGELLRGRGFLRHRPSPKTPASRNPSASRAAKTPVASPKHRRAAPTRV